jgi:hypothetical protein
MTQNERLDRLERRDEKLMSALGELADAMGQVGQHLGAHPSGKLVRRMTNVARDLLAELTATPPARERRDNVNWPLVEQMFGPEKSPAGESPKIIECAYCTESAGTVAAVCHAAPACKPASAPSPEHSCTAPHADCPKPCYPNPKLPQHCLTHDRSNCVGSDVCGTCGGSRRVLVRHPEGKAVALYQPCPACACRVCRGSGRKSIQSMEFAALDDFGECESCSGTGKASPPKKCRNPSCAYDAECSCSPLSPQEHPDNKIVDALMARRTAGATKVPLGDQETGAVPTCSYTGHEVGHCDCAIPTPIAAPASPEAESAPYCSCGCDREAHGFGGACRHKCIPYKREAESAAPGGVVLSVDDIATIDAKERGIPQAHEMARVVASHEELRRQLEAHKRGESSARDLLDRTMALAHEALGTERNGVAGLLGDIEELRRQLAETQKDRHRFLMERDALAKRNEKAAELLKESRTLLAHQGYFDAPAAIDDYPADLDALTTEEK